MRSIRDLLPPEELQPLLAIKDWRAAVAVASTWFLILVALSLVAWMPTWYTVLLAMIILGGRQLALAILMHEAAHRTLFRSRRLNDVVGQWLCAYPIWQDVHKYREHHLRHHAHTLRERDPDLCLHAAYPVTPTSLLRKFARDLLGITGLKLVIARFLMDLGRLRYTVSCYAGLAEPLPGRRWQTLQTSVHNVFGFACVQTLLLTSAWLVGRVWLFGLWWASYLTFSMLFVRIRSIAEHAMLPAEPDPWHDSRTTRANWLARLTVAPHRVNHHLEHHLAMTVPFYNLPKLHHRLRERGAIDPSNSAPGYLHVLRSAMASRA